MSPGQGTCTLDQLLVRLTTTQMHNVQTASANYKNQATVFNNPLTHSIKKHAQEAHEKSLLALFASILKITARSIALKLALERNLIQ